ncbi:MAG: hypothetical protein R3D98_10960 [Candidatus Krumholzibacteriia bacterium]
MTSRCLQPDDLPGALALPADDPRRRHLDVCPSCRALAHAYEEFIATDGGVWDAEHAEVEGELSRRLARHIEPATPAVLPRRTDRWRARSWLAAAAVLVVCAGVYLARDLGRLRDSRLPEGPGALRGDATPTVARWTETAAGWRLEWDAWPSGQPVVLFYDGLMNRLAARVARSGEIAPADVPEAARFLQLICVADTDTLARDALIGARPTGR